MRSLKEDEFEFEFDLGIRGIISAMREMMPRTYIRYRRYHGTWGGRNRRFGQGKAHGKSLYPGPDCGWKAGGISSSSLFKLLLHWRENVNNTSF